MQKSSPADALTLMKGDLAYGYFDAQTDTVIICPQDNTTMHPGTEQQIQYLTELFLRAFTDIQAEVIVDRERGRTVIGFAKPAYFTAVRDRFLDTLSAFFWEL